jgi:hypothetical protein
VCVNEMREGGSYAGPSLYRQDGAVRRSGLMLTQTSVPTGQDLVMERGGKPIFRKAERFQLANVVQ